MLPGGVEGGGEVVEEVGGKKKEKKALFTINESFGTLAENGGFRGSERGSEGGENLFSGQK